MAYRNKVKLLPLQPFLQFVEAGRLRCQAGSERVKEILIET